jgi:hypothetical protein
MPGGYQADANEVLVDPLFWTDRYEVAEANSRQSNNTTPKESRA